MSADSETGPPEPTDLRHATEPNQIAEADNSPDRGQTAEADHSPDPGQTAETNHSADPGQTADPRRTLGALGEELACAHLGRRGYQIIDRNFRTRWGELDIVASDGRSLVFCEVKCRRASRTWRDPLESVHARKQLQLRRMAGQWLAEHRGRQRVLEIRFDAIGVTVDGEGRLLRLDHLEGAF